MEDFKVTLTDRNGVELHEAITFTAKQRPDIIVFGDLVFRLAQIKSPEPSIYALVPNAVVLP